MCLSGHCPEEGSLQGLRHIKAEEAAGGIAVVLAALIDNAQIAMNLRLAVGDDAIQLPTSSEAS
jgi:hypothetical protein